MKERPAEQLAQSRSAARVVMEGGESMPVSGLAPKPPPVMVLYEDLADQAQLVFDMSGVRRKVRGVPVYGQYPRALIPAMLPWLGCARHEILHVCSGALPPGEGIRVDIRPEARPDILADGRKLPLPSGSVAAVMLDPPYNEHYSRELYGVRYPRPSQLLREAARVVRPGGRIIIVHYITPKPVPGTTFVKAFGLSTGFDMPMRAVSIYERDGAGPPVLPLGIDSSTAPATQLEVAEAQPSLHPAGEQVFTRTTP